MMPIFRRSSVLCGTVFSSALNQFVPNPAAMSNPITRALNRLAYNRFTLFLGIVWRPFHDGKRMTAETAWDVCKIVYPSRP